MTASGSRDPARDREIHRLYMHETKSMAEIGRTFGLTRERVRQVLAREGIRGRVVAEDRFLKSPEAIAVKLLQDPKVMIPDVARQLGLEPTFVWDSWKIAKRIPRRDIRSRRESIRKSRAEMYREGMTTNEIALALGAAQSRVLDDLRAEGVEMRPKGEFDPSKRRWLTDREKAEILRLSRRGVSGQRIGRKIGRTAATVCRFIQRSGVRS